ncbi:LysR substrate-binding domain-containing protein [Chitinimonas sp. PSY-7]|uniref:LysR substrate-binding domain-containing protein n=1 Tax=Chitinimonas sp. PSY-7 TaxID=3459088 RepID=UPI00403FE0B3
METIPPQFPWLMTFLAVVEHGSFSAAAEHLGHSKAYVSKQVTQLERALGVLLLHRTTRRISLTEPGQHYLRYCQQLRDTMDEASRAIGNLRIEVSGLVRLSTPTSLGVAYVGDLLLAFRTRYPQVQVELDLSQQTRDLVGERFDLAIRSGQVQDDRLIARPLGIIEEWIVAAPALLTKLGCPQMPSALLGQPCIINNYFSDGARWLFMRAGQHEYVEMSCDFCVNSYPAQRHLALAGAGYVKVPSYLVAQDVQQGQLCRVLEDYALPHMPLYLVYPPLHPQPAKVRGLIDFIVDWFSKHLVVNA